MKSIEAWKIVVASVTAGAVLFGTMIALLLLVAGSFAPPASASEPRPEIGRYVVAPNAEPGALWILDTGTGQVRACASAGDALTLTCGEWGPN